MAPTCLIFGCLSFTGVLICPPSCSSTIILLLNRSGSIVTFALVSYGGQFLGMLLPVLLGQPFIYAFYALIFIGVIRHVWQLIFLINNAEWKWVPQVAGNWIWLSLPLMLYALIGGLNQVVDSWLVNYIYAGEERVFAIFRYGAKELPLALALANALSLALIPEVSANLQSGLKQIKAQSTKTDAPALSAFDRFVVGQ